MLGNKGAEMREITKTINIKTQIPMFSVILAIIGYFIYGRSVDGALAIFLLSLFSGIITLAGVIPFIGVLWTYGLWGWGFDKIILWSGITQTWLTSLIFIATMVTSGIISFVVTLYIIGKMYKIKKMNITQVFTIIGLFLIGFLFFIEIKGGI